MKTPTPLFEAIEVNSTDIVCDGGQGALGHPRVYLQIELAVGQVVCPYCSRSFHYRGTSSHAA